MGILKHVQPGEPVGPPSAAIHNAMVDAALDYRRRMGSQTSRPAVAGSNYSVVLVRNDSEADRDRFNVLGIDDVVITPTDNLDEFKSRVALSGVKPTVADHVGKFVILLEPLKEGAIGRGLVSGVCPVQVDMTDAGHQWADVKDDDAGSLASSSSGIARILWADSGTGVLWAVVRVGGSASSALRYALLQEDLPGGAGNHALAHLMRLNRDDPDNAAWEDTSEEVEVYAPPLLAETDTLYHDTWVEIALGEDGLWYVRNASCSGLAS